MEDDKFDLTDLVRSLQREAGHEDCFRQGQASCDEIACPWRELCLPTTGEASRKQE